MTTTVANLDALVVKRYSLEKELDQVQAKIARMDDGFQYCVIVKKYRSCTKHMFSNFVAAFDYANMFVGENGYADVYTNNRETPEKRLFLGRTYYIDDVNKIDIDGNPKLPVTLLSRSMKEYSKML